VTPLLLIHGNADEYVPYENSTTALEAFTSRGAQNVRLITIEGGTHETSVIPAIIETINWFETF
jgi:dipeptidyl aminopeptidase/acylaminoacyl peptidase